MNNTQKGMGLIEILISIFIIGTCLVAFLVLVGCSLKISNLIKETNQAQILAQEALELLRNFRDNTDWNVNGLKNYISPTATSSGPYHLELIGSKWQLATGTETVAGFNRSIFFEKVSRDNEENIEQNYNSSRDDPDTRKVIVIINWKNKELRLATYLTNWK